MIVIILYNDRKYFLIVYCKLKVSDRKKIKWSEKQMIQGLSILVAPVKDWNNS